MFWKNVDNFMIKFLVGLATGGFGTVGIIDYLSGHLIGTASTFAVLIVYYTLIIKINRLGYKLNVHQTETIHTKVKMETINNSIQNLQIDVRGVTDQLADLNSHFWQIAKIVTKES